MSIRTLLVRTSAVVAAGALLAGPGFSRRPFDGGDRSGVCVGAVGAVACVPPDGPPGPPEAPTLPGS
jgi:hypothetical protein